MYSSSQRKYECVMGNNSTVDIFTYSLVCNFYMANVSPPTVGDRI